MIKRIALWFSSFFYYLRRPGLFWLSRYEINRVRNKLIGLYLHPTESISIAPVLEIFDLTEIRIWPGAKPKFTYRYGDHTYECWLRLPKEENPYWDLVVTPDGMHPLPIDCVAFKHILCRQPALVIKSLSRHFPYLPTENYLTNGGEYVA